ncbi:hypothetical protein LTR53_010871 [Teratosphaeriaceae sp. CCFEE 6253]|nr:hypothetical protein LTR53_010871 [Teratosphaeriaceae sp. CCFEE 6253]
MPQHKRGPWSQTEDSYLVHLVGLHGPSNWVRISAALQTRSPKQCRERFHQNLKPNLNHEPISPEEGLLIEQMVAEMGKRWAEIARRLRGRSDNAVKNWWNGGMNRRRRSNHPRRADGDPRQQAHMSAPNMPQLPTHHHALPSNYASSGPVQQHYYGQPIYPQPTHQHMPSSASGSSYRQSGYIETPLPSPSAFSQLSADAPSLMSDTSSVSGRSPRNGPSPIELPPLSRSQSDRRSSTGLGLRLSAAGSYTETDFSQPPIPTKHMAQMLQEPFQQHQQQYHHPQQLPQPTHYLPSQPADTVPSQPLAQYSMPPNPLLRGTYPTAYAQAYPMPTTPYQAVQLPSIANLAVSDMRTGSSSMPIDPALTTVRTPAVPSAPTPEGSPRDKMRLSNLTH